MEKNIKNRVIEGKKTSREARGKEILFILIFISSVFMLNFASSQAQTLGIVKQGSCINLTEGYPTWTFSKLSYIIYPDKTTHTYNIDMTDIGDGITFYYKFCNTTQLGEYQVYGYGDTDGTNTNWQYNFEVTLNGNEKPSEIIVVFFIIAFIFLLIFCIYELYMMLTHVFLLDYDAIDLAKAGGTYFAILALNILQNNYLGNATIQDFFLLFVQIGLWTNIIIPMMSFIFTLTVGNWIKLERVRKSRM